MDKPVYKNAWRRMLVDMHIPDWDPRFLSEYDPKSMADLYEQACLSWVMMYCQSHVGLCYWPASTGKMHPGLQGRDMVAELLAELRKRDLPACAYYSVIFNNWAATEHPEWRMVPHVNPPSETFHNWRFGLCCPNHPDYRRFALGQAEELASRYAFDGFFFDMTFLPTICACPWCQALFHEETGLEFPRAIDWVDPKWCKFQEARERWIASFAADLTACVRRARPGMAVYHNFATAVHRWFFACPLAGAIHHDFLGADFYGDPVEQLFVIKLMTNLTENKPVEFMTSRCVNLYDHVQLKSHELMEMQAHAASLFSAAFLFIDAIDPVGTVNPEIYERIGRIFTSTQDYEPHLGGEAVEDIALYFSNESKMDFTENGMPLAGYGHGLGFPHLDAVRGAVRILQRAHMPFGVITRKDLGNLDRFKLIILPNVLRMDDTEAEAFRAYVRRGGRLYASGYTSLTHTLHGRLDDFLLADVFGGRFGGLLPGSMYYLKPSSDEARAWFAPQDYISHALPAPPAGTQREDSLARAVFLGEQTGAEVLATLTMPYGHPAAGTFHDHQWASIHSSPPWEDTPAPALLRNSFGEGRAVYAALPVESISSEVNDHLFLALLASLLSHDPGSTRPRSSAGHDASTPGPLGYGADTHPAVWMNVQHQPGHSRFTVGFLNYQTDLPALPVPRTSFWLRPPEGKRFTRLTLLPGGDDVPFTTDTDGILQALTEDLEVFRLFSAEYA